MLFMHVQTNPPPGWYPNPANGATPAYWNGSRWTNDVWTGGAVMPYRPQAPAAMPTKYVTKSPRQTSHLFHLVMTICTAGLWAPVWLFMTFANQFGRKKSVTRVR